MKLSEALPVDFFSCGLDGCRAEKFLDVEVVRVVDSRVEKFPGKHKNVWYWWELVNGYAVGWNENPSIGYSFPVVKLKKKE